MPDFIPRLLTFCFIGVLFTASAFLLPAHAVSGIIFLLLCYVLGWEWPQFCRPTLTPLYPIAPFLALIYLNASDHRSELLWLFAIIAAHDTGAYVTGNLCGTHKIAPAISPGKSWEGFFGGLLFSYCISMLAVHLLSLTPCLTQLSQIQHVALIFMLNCVGTMGDLFESSLKRSVGLKDSGTLLPGHGGILDRFDSMLFAVPAWLIIRWLLVTFRVCS